MSLIGKPINNYKKCSGNCPKETCDCGCKNYYNIIKTSKEIIEVFPDFMSTHLWRTPKGAPIEYDELEEVIPNHLIVAIRY